MEPSNLTTGPSEIGSLTAQSYDESQFVGSSSGVFFIKTVRQAFSQNLDGPAGASSTQDFPQPEDTLLGSDASPHDRRSIPASAKASPAVTEPKSSLGEWEYDPTVAAVLGNAPPLETARQLMMVYFKVWHPLFPFLHGPTFLQAMELLYSTGGRNIAHSPSSAHRSTCWTTIFQCVFNLASHLRPDLQFPAESRVGSPSSIHTLLGTLTGRNDLPSLQALLASQLYLVAKMSLRTASTVGGCMLRSMLHAGLHRCPFRYRELSSHDRQLRKRIFWSAYAIDRYLSQALGLPLGIQDSDIDVCASGAHEIHIPGAYNREWPSFLPPAAPAAENVASPHTENPSFNGPRQEYDTTVPMTPTRPPTSGWHSESHQHRREIAFASYVESGKLTGQALELFHKSILVRSVRRSSVLFLVTDVHKWWNSLSADLQGVPTPSLPSTSTETPFNFGPFFTVLYQHLILLIHRPSLSLSPSTAEFASSLQTCIGAAREILSALKTQVDAGQALFWPGYLSAAWMAGLVLAFACQLRQYVLEKASREISECLDFLHLMSTQWETAKHCHRALSLLAHNIHHHQQLTSPSTTPTPASTPFLRRDLPGSQPRKPHERQGQRQRDRSPSTTDPNIDPENRKRRRVESTTDSPLHDQYPSRTSHDAPASMTAGGNSHHYQTGTSMATMCSEIPPVLDNRRLGGDDGEAAGRSLGSDPYRTALDQDQDYEDRLFFPDGSATSMMDFDLSMADLLQGANFDNLVDMFGQQYPSF
ncbi:transcription factor domain-containing protein [Aspergillus affinis]|uniref:transcription factor domain-containing protein n=1 Tax=Aspergillus affinis TaxID=1070780 RepID=UPI0022FEC24C|nr:fungal-specific transcription factor [Aspergillus affinis]KAI9043327.1 fungal-specific transcription factor [Aspergillus affinis]